ncbi:putative (di)nucleoside polyphosphate hydrolase [Bradyrhizobium sp. LM6.11]
MHRAGMTTRDPHVTDQKPYRPNVGIALFNADGRVLIGHRFKGDGPEIILPGLDWQMPQGGVDEGEDLRDAALRELWEETSVKSAAYLGETDWLTYEFPPYDGPQTHRLAKFRGQRQKWFALRFTGKDDEIDPLTPRNDQPAEFDAWRWERLDRVPDVVVPFRREVYRAVAPTVCALRKLKNARTSRCRCRAHSSA